MANREATAGVGMALDGSDPSKLTYNNTLGDPNTIVCTQASDFTGVLDSTKLYIVSGIIDFTGTGINIEIPAGGLSMAGSSFDLSGLICSDDNYTLFTSPVGGSGNLTKRDFYCTTSGLNSQVYALTSATNFDAFEIARINWNSCTSLGYLEGFRQGVETGTGRFGGKPELELRGAWAGGYFINTSIVRQLVDGAYTLFKAGAGFVMQSRFRSDQNIDLPASVSFFDFASANFPNSSTIQLLGMIMTRNGVVNANDANLTPNISRANIACSWTGNLGLLNTFEGGRIDITNEAQTVISAGSTYYTVNAGAWLASELQHFDNPNQLELRHLGDQPREYKVSSEFAVEGTANNVLSMRIKRWVDVDSNFVTLPPLSRQVLNSVGGRDVAFFSFNQTISLDKNDYFFFEIANNSGNGNITLEVDSSFICEER